MNLQDLLRVLNCLSYEEFNLILNGTWTVEDHRKAYTNEKWESFRKNLANFLMDLDSEYFQLFIKFAEVKLAKQQKR